MNKWDERLMRMALEVKSWSKDPDNQVGAVLVSPERREFAVGYNGLPVGFDDENGLQRMAGTLDESYRWLKDRLSLHAEANALDNCQVRPAGWTMYATRCPCVPCATKMIQNGVAALVCPGPEPESSWYASHKAAMHLLSCRVLPRVHVTLVTEDWMEEQRCG